MADDPFRRIVLLNRLVSRSVTRNRSGQEPWIHRGNELIGLLRDRVQRGVAIEFNGGESNADEEIRLSINRGKNYIRIREINFSQERENSPTFVAMLFEFWDSNRKAFHVVNPTDFIGRPLVGNDAERGATTIHFMVRLPAAGRNDDGSYRCVMEAMPSLSRSVVEYLLCRQLRRVSDAAEWVFDVVTQTKKGKAKSTPARYTPRLELHADVGRRINGGAASKILQSMKFVKRASRESTGGATIVNHTEFVADVHIKISASDGPKEPTALVQWARNIRTYYENMGFETSLAFKALDGGMDAGKVVPGLDGATDLLMCQREAVDFALPREIWEPAIRPDVIASLKALLEKDELWERSEAG